MADFDYDLPAKAVAQTPIEPRSAARLLVDRSTRIQHRRVSDLPVLLEPGDLLVVNDTKVIPARLRLQRSSGGAVEVLLLERVGHDCWEAMVKPSRKLAVGERVSAGDLVVELGERRPDAGTRLVRLLSDDPMATLAHYGAMPLPPYITAPLTDPDRYQTVYADRPGAAAAPTAGLHFTPELLQQLADRGVDFARVELVVGLDTFRPVAVDDPADHRIHTEAFTVRDEVMKQCRAARRVVAVGTTTLRALESAAIGMEGRTDLYIRRPFPFQVVDVLLTNFHLPRSSLLLLVDAFVGPRWRELYEVALADGYRFLSFGDAMLLERG
jgi:S-adenosylmethionine:tRNA ribosyltransferase-isomerase